MTELTEREKLLAKELEEEYERALKENPPGPFPEKHSDKFSFPIGVDDKGNPFPVD